MSTENLDGIYSLPAAADFTAVRGRFGVVNTSGQAALCGAGALAHGIIHNFPAAGDPARLVLRHGAVVKMEVGAGGVTLGSAAISDATGKVINSATSGQIRNGIVLQAGAAGDIVAVLFLPNNGANP